MPVLLVFVGRLLAGVGGLWFASVRFSGLRSSRLFLVFGVVSDLWFSCALLGCFVVACSVLSWFVVLGGFSLLYVGFRVLFVIYGFLMIGLRTFFIGFSSACLFVLGFGSCRFLVCRASWLVSR